VNLLDGLDGLCSSVSSVVLGVFAVIIAITANSATGVYLNELNNIIIVTLGVVGAVIGFLCFNSYPAGVFMGDTGSLALGGFVASIFALTKQYFLIFVVGFVFVMTALSVIMQVFSYRVFKKRIFKMSPIHHHFEMYIHESKVTTLYVLLTILLGLLAIILYL